MLEQSPLGGEARQGSCSRQGSESGAVALREVVAVACESPQHCGQQSSDGAQETWEMIVFSLLRLKRARDIQG